MSAQRMGPDEYFWNIEFQFDLREAMRGEQEAVRVLFLAQRLDLDGFTLRHIELVELVLGRPAIARQSPEFAKLSPVAQARINDIYNVAEQETLERLRAADPELLLAAQSGRDPVRSAAQRLLAGDPNEPDYFT